VNVRVEAAKCEGYGTCAVHLAELFKLDEWGYAYVEGDGAVPAADEDRARRAILDCPVHAIGERPA
jgi:ferredoxin